MSAGYLIDTNVASASAPGKPEPDRRVADWLRATLSSRPVFISVITIAEIERGIRLMERSGPTRRSALLRQWLLYMEHEFSENFLSFELRTARVLGELDAAARLTGHEPDLADIIVAATARVHNLTVVTRNVRHFTPLGVSCLDPFSEHPD